MPIESKPVNDFTDRLPAVGELEWSREPHETISATSLGQAAEAMDMACGGTIDELNPPRVSGFRGRPSHAKAELDLQCLNSVALACSDTRDGMLQHRADQVMTEAVVTSPQGATHSAQQPEDPDVRADPRDAPFDFLRGRAAHSTFESQREGSAPTDIQNPVLSPASTSATSVSPKGPARQDEHTVVNPLGQLQIAGHPTTVTRESPSPRNSNSTLNDAYTPPGWLMLIEFVLSVIIKAIILNAIPTIAYAAAAVVSLSLPSLRHCFFRVLDWCVPTPQVPSQDAQPMNPSPATDESVGPAPGGTEMANIPPNLAESKTPSIQCHQCSASCSKGFFVRCPSGHPICVDCLSTEVAQQATSNVSPGAVCKHRFGCGKPYTSKAILALPEAIIWQLIDCAGPAREKKRLPPKRDSKPLVDSDEFSDSSPADSNKVSPRLEVAISSGAVAVHRRGQRQADRSSEEQAVPVDDVKGKQRAPLSVLCSDTQGSHIDSQDSDIEYGRAFYGESISAFRSATVRTYTGALAGPSNSGLPYTSVPSEDPRAITAPPSRDQLSYASTSGSVPISAPQTRANEDPMTRAKRILKNAKARLRTARAAHDKNPCAKTRAKIEKEFKDCEMAQKEVNRLQV